MDTTSSHTKTETIERALLDRMPPAAQGGEILPLRFYPHADLGKRCAPVEAFDEELRKLIKDMAFTMYMCGGVGLAAPQVGVLRRIFVTDARTQQGEVNFRVFINPTIVGTSFARIKNKEACLSIPTVVETIERPATVDVTSFDVHGARLDEQLVGWQARVFLHEYDHLEGVTMLDQLGQIAKRFALRKVEKFRRRSARD